MTTPSGDDLRPSGSFCALPWLHLSTTVDGVWGRCCFDATNDYDHYYRQADEPEFRLVPDALGCLPQSRYAAANPRRGVWPDRRLQQSRAAPHPAADALRGAP